MFVLSFRNSTSWTLFLLLVYLACLSCIKSETVVDTCKNVHNRQRRLGSLQASSANLVVDHSQRDAFDGDDGRFKRTNASPGLLSYLSNRGFERIQITGYVFGALPRDSWSLQVTEGDAVTPGANTTDVLLTLNADNVRQYIQNQAGGWNRFQLQLVLNTTCPDRLTIILNGAASNNEYAGWGLQLARIVLVQSWFKGCTASCSFKKGTCSSRSYHQAVDPANDFRDVYSLSKNIRVDASNARKFHGGDAGRFTRSNKNRGELVYVSTDGFHAIDIEIFQFRPYNTKLSVIPYTKNSCQPMVLPASYRTSRQSAEGWKHKIALFDLKDLPMCPTHIILRIEGGQQGWEMQISRITFTIYGKLERDPSVSYRLKRSTDDDDDESGISWWIYMIIIVVAIIVLLMAGCLVRRFAHCCGGVQRERRLPIWNSRAWRRGERAYELDIPGSPSEATAPKKPDVNTVEKADSFSFPVKQDGSLER